MMFWRCHRTQKESFCFMLNYFLKNTGVFLMKYHTYKIGNYFEIFSSKSHCLKVNISHLQGGCFIGHIFTYKESADREAPLNVCNLNHCHQQSEIPESVSHKTIPPVCVTLPNCCILA